MNRRQVLASCGLGAITGFAGCLSNLRSHSGDREDSSTDGRQILLVDTEDDDPESGFEFRVEQLSATLSPDQIPELEITFHNAGDSEFVFSEGTEGSVRWFSPGPSDPAGLKLLTENERSSILSGSVRTAHQESCWTLEYIDRTDIIHYQKLEPDESSQQRFGVIGNHRAASGECPEPGEYRFSTTYTLLDDTAADEAIGQFDWGFTLEVRDSG